MTCFYAVETVFFFHIDSSCNVIQFRRDIDDISRLYFVDICSFNILLYFCHRKLETLRIGWRLWSLIVKVLMLQSAIFTKNDIWTWIIIGLWLVYGLYHVIWVYRIFFLHEWQWNYIYFLQQLVYFVLLCCVKSLKTL